MNIPDPPWIGDDDYGVEPIYSKYDYDYDHQDDDREMMKDLEDEELYET